MKKKSIRWLKKEWNYNSFFDSTQNGILYVVNFMNLPAAMHLIWLNLSSIQSLFPFWSHKQMKFKTNRKNGLSKNTVATVTAAYVMIFQYVKLDGLQAIREFWKEATSKLELAQGHYNRRNRSIGFSHNKQQFNRNYLFVPLLREFEYKCVCMLFEKKKNCCIWQLIDLQRCHKCDYRSKKL